jgi:hypothetical protein
MRRAPAALLTALLAGGPADGAPATTGSAALVATPPQVTPLLVAVPAALRARVPQLELSGIAWAAPLDRYLVVVDDTVDLRTDQRHAPFVLALDRNGRLDADPIPVEGIDAIDDAESIAAGPDETFYLLTSHAPNKRGKLAKARRQLLQLRLSGHRLRKIGALDLRKDAGGIGPALARLQLPEDSDVDLEAVAFHEDALFIGLKAPLARDGSAIILRLVRPAAAFKAGRLSPDQLAPWATVQLAIAGGVLPAAVHQGIADLFFHRDGALYLCANAPKGGPADGGGALWRVARPGPGPLHAQQLRQFPALKPEGVTPAPTGDALTLVFDRGPNDPLWLSWPLAH